MFDLHNTELAIINGALSDLRFTEARTSKNSIYYTDVLRTQS